MPLSINVEIIGTMAVTVNPPAKQAMNMQDDDDGIFVKEETGAALELAEPLLYDMFAHPETQVENVRAWNSGEGWGFTEAEIGEVAAQLEHINWPDRYLTVLVLVAYLETVQRTFDEHWSGAARVQPSSLLLSGIKSDPRHLWLAQGIKHEPGLRWEIINFNGYLTGKEHVSPIEVRGSNSAHAGVLAAAAHSPLWVQAMAGENVPPVWIPGYHVRTASLGDSTRTMHLDWRPPTGLGCIESPLNPGGITLAASLSDGRACPWAGPIITWAGPIVKPTRGPLSLRAGSQNHLALSA